MRTPCPVPWRRSALGLAVALAVTAVSPVALAQAAPGPNLTVVGFGVADLPATGPTLAAEEINFNLSVDGSTAGSALATIRADLSRDTAALGKAGVTAAQITLQGPPAINFNSSLPAAKCAAIQKVKGKAFTCPRGAYQAYASLTVTLPTLGSAARVLDRISASPLPGVQNFFLNPATSAVTPTAASLERAYAQALAQARSTARMLAAADHLTLGVAASIREGAPAQAQCGAMGGCPVGLAPGIVAPTAGPGQVLVAVTVTYRTSL